MPIGGSASNPFRSLPGTSKFSPREESKRILSTLKNHTLTPLPKAFAITPPALAGGF